MISSTRAWRAGDRGRELDGSGCQSPGAEVSSLNTDEEVIEDGGMGSEYVSTLPRDV